MPKIFRHIFRSIIRPALSPWQALTTTMLGVFTGLLGSLYSEQIKGAFPFCLWSYSELQKASISHIALSFWSLLFMFAFFFFHREHSVIISHKNELELFEKLIRTLPPKDFLEKFKLLFIASHKAKNTIFSTEEKTTCDIESCIRLVLGSIVALAHQFDGCSEKVTYAANIMIYIPIDCFTQQEISELHDRMPFVEKEIDLSKLRGVLDLQLTLSRSTTSKPDPDPHLKPLALAIPTEIRTPSSGRWRVLPGAPIAFSDKEKVMDLFSDTSTFDNWFRESGDFSPSVEQSIKEYFSSDEGKKIKSFISIPIDSLMEDDYPIGVLNIHRDSTNLLADEDRARLFLPLVAPFINLLAELLIALEDQKGKSPDKDKIPPSAPLKTDTLETATHQAHSENVASESSIV